MFPVAAEAIEALPLANTPEVFGLHPNAEIGYYTQAARDMWAHLLELQPQTGELCGGAVSLTGEGSAQVLLVCSGSRPTWLPASQEPGPSGCPALHSKPHFSACFCFRGIQQRYQP